jgi:hypothetical protein
MQMSMKKHDRILVISDLHFPYHHPDTFPFLIKLKDKYKCTKIVMIGDEMDWHSINVSHIINPDLPAPADELEIGRSLCKQLEKIFPEMVLLESNHGSMVLRRAMAKGMSRFFLKDYNEILDVGSGWRWEEKHIIKTDKNTILFAHQFCKDIGKAVRETSMCCVQGHFHTVSETKMIGTDYSLNWGMSVGCLVDKKSLAMAYMKVNLAKPILSCGIITEGIPHIVPMVLNTSGSWDKNIYI